MRNNIEKVLRKYNKWNVLGRAMKDPWIFKPNIWANHNFKYLKLYREAYKDNMACDMTLNNYNCYKRDALAGPKGRLP